MTPQGQSWPNVLGVRLQGPLPAGRLMSFHTSHCPLLSTFYPLLSRVSIASQGSLPAGCRPAAHVGCRPAAQCVWQCVCRDFERAGGSPRLRFAPWCGSLAVALASRFGGVYPRASALRLMCFWQCVCRDFEWAGGSPRLRFAPWCGRLAAVLASRFGGVYPRASALRLMCGCGTPFGCRTLPESQALLGIRLSRACGQGGHTGNTDFPVVPIRSRMPPPSGILLLPFRVIPACS
jgi:hypothetical protein